MEKKFTKKDRESIIENLLGIAGDAFTREELETWETEDIYYTLMFEMDQVDQRERS